MKKVKLFSIVLLQASAIFLTSCEKDVETETTTETQTQQSSMVGTWNSQHVLNQTATTNGVTESFSVEVPGVMTYYADGTGIWIQEGIISPFTYVYNPTSKITTIEMDGDQ